MNFTDFKFKDFIQKALLELNFKKPTPIQERLIPIIKKNKSVVGQSQTGSGKTHTFLLPLFDQIDLNIKKVQVVITTPSRELAYQIYESAKQIAKFSNGISVQNYVGGTDKKRQVEKLRSEQPQIVIGTPGRILDLIRINALDVHQTKHLVVDEADMTLDLGFLKETDSIASSMPKDLQMLVFSATIPEKLRPFLKKYMQNPHVETIDNKNVIASNVSNWLISTKGKDKNDLVYQLITIGQPYLALIFTNTKEEVNNLSDYLKSRGLKVAKIHGDVPPRQRKRIMKEIQSLKYQYVVATDLAARGIDIVGVSHVINVDIPKDLEFFIHRVGRTGRNDLKGIAITMYNPGEEQRIAELEKLGIIFEPKTLKNGQLVDYYDRNRRIKRNRYEKTVDSKLQGMINKAKKHKKPRYRKKINNEIQKVNRQNKRLERRQQLREQRQNRK